MKTQLYKIGATFAKSNNLPHWVAAVELKETQKAVFLYGHGTLETVKHGTCCMCGRGLVHPVSVKLGIGPICGGHEHSTSFTESNLEELKKEMSLKLEEYKIDQWVPKSLLKEILPSEEQVQVPSDHKMLNNKDDAMARTKIAKLHGNDQIQIRFPFDWKLLGDIKAKVNGRKFNPKDKYWYAPYSLENVKVLKELGFPFDEALQQKAGNKEKGETDKIEDIKPIDVHLKRELFTYQKTGLGFLEARKGRALLADEMGLGKTMQALAYMQLRNELRPALIICPASLKYNWKKEIEMTLPERNNILVCNGATPDTKALSAAEIIIINYDILPAWTDALESISIQLIIADEAHYFKNNKAKRTKAVKLLAKQAPHFIALTGTPIVNRPIEIYNALKIISPQVAGNFMDFARRYCDAKHNGYGWDFNGSSNTQELHEKLQNRVMIRRVKKDVLKDLPDKVYSTIEMPLNNQKEYTQAEANLVDFVKNQTEVELQIKLEESLGKEMAGMVNVDNEKLEALKQERASKINILSEIEILKQLAVKGKLDGCMNWIQDAIENGEKLVVFGVHKFVIDTLMKRFGKMAVKIDGSVSQQARHKAVEEFQNNDNVRLFIGNIQAAGTGLTLTAASKVAFLELPWTPGELQQAIDRLHRIGQKNTVNVYYLLAYATIEEKIAKLLHDKMSVLNAVLDGKQSSSANILNTLIEGMKK
jgi:SWI/SNF-related matrix-associated actin-dependent regulator 1 of chromatin subfamily A